MRDRSEDSGRKRKKIIFRAWFIHPKTGEKIYAWQFGKRAFAIPVDDDE